MGKFTGESPPNICLTRRIKMATSQDTDLQKQIENLKLNNPADINILLLGETGVGKSTFINSIANYLTYTKFEKASKENLLTLIPSKFNIQDKHGNQHIIQTSINEDKNEYLETGMSATQDVKTYVFPIWGGQTKIRLIDTPGMGDTRGIRQDDINCENILSYIGQLHELHAICFMFKPTNTRLTQFFGYCMSQILSRLDKSASKNIIFVFTNTRGTDYGPGDTFQTLQRVVREIEETPPNTIVWVLFFIYIYKEILIKYIIGDAKNSPLKPHFIKSTSAINEARRLIIQLAQPLAEITQLISDNLFALQRHEQHLNIDNTSLEELRKRLYIPIIDLDVTKLTQPATVCASSKWVIRTTGIISKDATIRVILQMSLRKSLAALS
ncbi:hypothetical protein NQ318_016879 [Aromia moschata]|uniref:G domain-containing protein n=1 Tax=Aromia moschata TaxID=1265417 RepID=A0AAV8X3N2_9CUCU|nr:hypothetical protein NQ318_016879 [Aromia moschata]